jgi:hypothetical protein
MELGRLHSNRNDFQIRFENKDTIDESTKEKQRVVSMHSSNIPFLDKDESIRYVTPFYISVNKSIMTKSLINANRNSVDKWMSNMRNFSKYGSSGTTQQSAKNLYRTLYKKIIGNPDKVGTNVEDTMNFGLARLMLSFSIIFGEENGDYFGLPLAGEYIDLSYSYKSDIRSFMYEDFANYVPLNGINNIEFATKVIKIHNNLIEYIENGYVEQQRHDRVDEETIQNNVKKMETALQNFDEVTFLLDGYTKDYLHERISSVLGCKLIQCKTLDAPNENELFRAFFRIVKFYVKYGYDVAPYSRVNYDTIYFPKLSVFIIDLYSILFSESAYPWEDIKYAKRLHRYVFFVFIEKLALININNVTSILYDLGIQVYLENDDYDNITKKDPTETIDKFKNLQGPYNRSKNKKPINPLVYNLLHRYGKNKKYLQNNSTDRVFDYFFKRLNDIYDMAIPVTKYKIGVDDIPERIIDDTGYDTGYVKKNINYVVSACGIDHFMYNYHLLDFFDTIDNATEGEQIRYRFIVKRNMIKNEVNVGEQYVLVTIPHNIATDNLEDALEIINSTPSNVDYYDGIINPSDPPNNDVELLRSEKIVKQYVLIRPTSDDPFLSNLYKYINEVEYIREKLIVTILNYIYDTAADTKGTKNLMYEDTTKMILNMYEGDIDKILST